MKKKKRYTEGGRREKIGQRPKERVFNRYLSYLSCLKTIKYMNIVENSETEDEKN